MEEMSQDHKHTTLLHPGEDQRLTTLVISHIVRPGMAAQFDEWSNQIDKAVTHFPGYHNSIRLSQAGGLNHVIVQFETAETFENWLKSDEFRELDLQGRKHGARRRAMVYGHQGRLVIPSEAAAPKWKAAIATWLGVFPCLIAMNALLGWLALPWPDLLIRFISSVILTAFLTWIILPRVRATLRPWILAEAQVEERTR